ncbi:YaaC family protein [Kitasatospora sp. NPDC059599]|uniref:YaaC family protein n=1 Tax=Kitasatospora sp. NPDC059599 TaxID=3346880 RepID=UPI003694070D
MVTYTSSQDAWNALRGARSAPPGLAVDLLPDGDCGPSRREVFRAALEQAQQFFQAADAVGPATQPLPLFYGLSQAGRAIAAAARSLPGEEWKLNTHGISTENEAAPLLEVRSTTSRPDSRGSFTRLSRALKSPVWWKPKQKADGEGGEARERGDGAMAFADLWTFLPVSRDIPLFDGAAEQLAPLIVDHRNLHPEPHLQGGIRIGGLPARVLDAPDSEAALDAYLARFPGTRGPDISWWPREGEQRLVRSYEREADGSGSMAVAFHAPDGRALTRDGYLDRLRPITRRHDGDWYFTPAIGESTRGIHPLMAWWAVMHALSNLVRYQPAEWARHIDVDESVHAVPIERLLVEARRVLPIVIAETLDEVAT